MLSVTLVYDPKAQQRGLNPSPSGKTYDDNDHTRQTCDHQLMSLLLDLCKPSQVMQNVRTLAVVVIIGIHMECGQKVKDPPGTINHTLEEVSDNCEEIYHCSHTVFFFSTF